MDDGWPLGGGVHVVARWWSRVCMYTVQQYTWLDSNSYNHVLRVDWWGLLQQQQQLPTRWSIGERSIDKGSSNSNNETTTPTSTRKRKWIASIQRITSRAWRSAQTRMFFCYKLLHQTHPSVRPLHLFLRCSDRVGGGQKAICVVRDLYRTRHKETRRDDSSTSVECIHSNRYFSINSSYPIDYPIPFYPVAVRRVTSPSIASCCSFFLFFSVSSPAAAAEGRRRVRYIP